MRLRHLPLLALFALPLPAAADSLYGTRSAEVHETAHTIELAFDRGHATLVVHRTFQNDGPKHDQAELHIYDLPGGGVATGLKTLGYVDGRPVWYTGDLLEAELAAKRYRELTGIGGYYPKDPALLSWRSQSELALQVFPIDPKGGLKTIEYTLEVPTTYADGAWHLELPRMSTGALSATVTPHAVNAKDAIVVDGSPLASKLMLAGASFELRPFDAPKLGGRFASVSFAKNKTLVHTAFEAAPKLSEAPKGAYVVVVLDGSKSMDDAARTAQIAATSAYLSHLPDAKVQIVTFDRFVRPVTSAFVPAADGLATLGKMAFLPRNGSAVDLALEDAAQRIATAPSGAPRRVLLLSDLRTRSAIDPSKLAPFSASKTIVHIGTIAGGAPGLYRDDTSPWSAHARATGGLVWHAVADGKNVPRAKKVFEEWVRPLRIDRLSVKGIEGDELSFPDTLAEGEGFADLRILPAGASSIEVKGELWSTPVKATFASTPAEERRWSALVFGSDLMHSLSEPEMMTLAKKGGAVSPVTSYLAIEPGVRPSTAGLEEGEAFGVGGFGLIGHGSGGGGAWMKAINMTISRRKFLEARMVDALATCGGAGRALRVIFETTTREIVAADTMMPTAAKVAPQAASDEALRHCVEDRMWSIDLPTAFTEKFEKLDVSVAGT
ncbi:MAG: VWA domain-containing protein [Polyangiales bacterium]